MARWTTLLLDDDTQEAVRRLARHYRCSFSQAMRRAVVCRREPVIGPGAEVRRRRRRVLERLFEILEGNDPADEVRRLKSQDQGS